MYIYIIQYMYIYRYGEVFIVHSLELHVQYTSSTHTVHIQKMCSEKQNIYIIHRYIVHIQYASSTLTVHKYYTYTVHKQYTESVQCIYSTCAVYIKNMYSSHTVHLVIKNTFITSVCSTTYMYCFYISNIKY